MARKRKAPAQAMVGNAVVGDGTAQAREAKAQAGNARARQGKAPRVNARGRRLKGNRFENEFAKAVGGKRVPLSGAYKSAGKEFSEDVVMPNGWRVQCKALHNGFRTLYTLLESADAVGLRADHKPALIVMTLARFMEVFEDYAERHNLA